MKKDDEINRNFNARMFIKGKCYTFDTLDEYNQPVNDKEITSILMKLIVWFKYIINNFSPTTIFYNKQIKKIIIRWMIILGLISFFFIISYFLIFKFNITITF
jgi:hypothetical protein